MKGEIIMVYKVVQIKNENKYTSLFVRKSKYKLKYKIGEITTAPIGTLGIFCFILLLDAQNFMQNFLGISLENTTILEVDGIGDFNVPSKISKYMSELSLDKYYDEEIIDKIDIPVGTVCYPSVSVIGEAVFELGDSLSILSESKSSNKSKNK